VNITFTFAFTSLTAVAHPVMFSAFILHVLPPNFSINLEIIDGKAAGVYKTLVLSNVSKLSSYRLDGPAGRDFSHLLRPSLGPTPPLVL
jgi:hypothetical protein